MRDLEPYLENIAAVLGDRVLVATYLRPEKTASQILLPDSYRAEDSFQGKAGLVIKMGDLAFQDDESHKWGRAPQVGEWVAFRVGDGWPVLLGEHPCRLVRDVHVAMILSSPDVVL